MRIEFLGNKNSLYELEIYCTVLHKLPYCGQGRQAAGFLFYHVQLGKREAWGGVCTSVQLGISYAWVFYECTTGYERGVGFYLCTAWYKRGVGFYQCINLGVRDKDFTCVQLGMREAWLNPPQWNERNQGF
jgi:hypothetical protein